MAMRPDPSPAPPPALPENVPVQALLLLAWVAGWAAVEAALGALGLAAGTRLGVFLGLLAALAGALALGLPDGSRRLLVSVRFAVTQGIVLAAAGLLGLVARRLPGVPAGWPFHGLPFAALLALLAASALAITWQRRPYPWSRVGFLVTHISPTVLLAGCLWSALPGGAGPGRALLRCGWAGLLAGCAWMFYLKPVLKRREAAAPERRP